VTTVSTNPYLSGNFAPVTEEVTVTDLAVTGTIPAGLEGRLLRIGPNPVTPPDPATYHWFTGDGMVHGVRLRDGRAEWYRNRWVRGRPVTDALGEPPLPGPVHADMTTANTHVIGHAGRTFALVEAGARPVELSDELESIAHCDFDGTLDGGFTAHPHRDPVTGELHAVTYHWAWDHLRYLIVDPEGRVRREVRVPVDGGPMVHDCAITESHVLVLDLPVAFDLDVAASGGRFPYTWQPDRPARVGVLPHDGDADDVRWCEVEPCYVFHPLNAYETGDGRIVVDVVRHPSVFATDRRGPDDGPPTLDRWTLDPATGRTTEERLDDRGQEFPRLDDRIAGRRHRFGYGAALASGLAHGPALKHDLERGTTEEHRYGEGRVTLEPVFVPRADDAAEDDGWVLSYVHDATTDTSDVVILSAQDFTGDPVATIHLPVRVPFGFHGSWVPDA
jgi:carotenoid cleavage dioxygenase